MDEELFGIDKEKLKKMNKEKDRLTRMQKKVPADLAEKCDYVDVDVWMDKVNLKGGKSKAKLTEAAKKEYLKKGKKKKKKGLKSTMTMSESVLTSEFSEMDVSIGEDGLPQLDDDMEGMDGEGENGDMEGEGAEGEENAGDEEEKEGEEGGDDAGEEEGDAGAEGDMEEEKSPADGASSGGALSIKKKRTSLSKSPKKKKKKGDPDFKFEVVNYKQSVKNKNRLIIEDKLEIPEEILEHVKTSMYPEEENPLDLVTVDELKKVVLEMYTRVQRKKLAQFFEFQKVKPVLSHWLRMIIHMVMNLGPRQGLNEDIEEKQEEEDQEGTMLPENEAGEMDFDRDQMDLDNAQMETNFEDVEMEEHFEMDAALEPEE